MDYDTSIWEHLVCVNDTFWGPCTHYGNHESEPKRFYDLETHRIACEVCCGQSNVKIFRNMLHNVIRIPREQGRKLGIQVFISNTHTVVYLKPFKSTNNPFAGKVCACGRGVNTVSTYCSVECYLAKDTRQRFKFHPVAFCAKYRTKYRRKAVRAEPSPVC